VVARFLCMDAASFFRTRFCTNAESAEKLVCIIICRARGHHSMVDCLWVTIYEKWKLHVRAAFLVFFQP